MGEARRRREREAAERSGGAPLRLLVVDWDYFIPVPLRLDPVLALMNEGFMIFAENFLRERGAASDLYSSVWALNAAALINAGEPLLSTSSEEASFWKRFRFAPGASALVAKENFFAAAAEIRENVGEVWLFDAHHDCGYGDVTPERYQRVGIASSNWMLEYGLAGCSLKVRYPRWKDWALQHEPEPIVAVDRAVDEGHRESLLFDRLFICRSDFYTPPWLDAGFKAFVDACPLTTEPLEECAPRAYDRQLYDEFASLLFTSITRLREAMEGQLAPFAPSGR